MSRSRRRADDMPGIRCRGRSDWNKNRSHYQMNVAGAAARTGQDAGRVPRGYVSAGGRRDPSRCVAPGRRARARRPPGRRASPAGSSAAAIVPIVAARSRPRSSRNTPPRAWRIEPANAGWRRPLRRPTRPLARNAQPPASGHASHRGVGRHTSRPRFMTAWFQSPGASRASQRDAASATSVSVTSSGSAANASRAITLRTFVSIAATGEPIRDRRHRGRRVRTDAGEGEQRGEVGRHDAVVIADDAASGLVQRGGAPRVPSPPHARSDVSSRRRRERAHVREPLHERRGTPRPRATPASVGASPRRRGPRTDPVAFRHGYTGPLVRNHASSERCAAERSPRAASAPSAERHEIA